MVAARAIGARSIRVRLGRFATAPAPIDGEPDLEIADIGALEAALDDLASLTRARPLYAQGVARHA
jgi:hypothetical protein